MEQTKNLEELCSQISDALFETKSILQILEEHAGMDRQIGVMLKIMYSNVQNSFDNIETCRRMISVPD